MWAHLNSPFMADEPKGLNTDYKGVWKLLAIPSGLLFLVTLLMTRLVQDNSIAVNGKVCNEVNVRVEPAVLQVSGDKVRASWSSISRASGDWIGIFDGAKTPVELTRHQVGQGNTGKEYTLYNLRRHGYVFRYFRVDGSLAGCSEPVTFAMGDAEPTQLRTALTTDPNALRVMWVTSQPDTPVVSVRGELTEVAVQYTGSNRTYSASDLCEPPRLWQEPGWVHDVLVKGVTAGEKFYFRHGNRGPEGDVVWAPGESAVTMPPLAGDEDKPVEMIIVGDMGNSRPFCKDCRYDFEDDQGYQDMCGPYADGAPQVVGSIEALLNRSKDIVAMVHVGDLSYACSVEQRWDYWMDTIQPISSQIPYMISVGNHEYGYVNGTARDPSGVNEPYVDGPTYGGDDSFGECGVPTDRRFHMPENGNGVFWYSFEAGLLHVTVFSLEHNISLGTPQRSWFDADLSAVNRSRTPWVLVTTHRPLYSDQYGAPGSATDADNQNGLHQASILDDALQEHKVNLFIGGHYHSYERLCPIHKGQCLGDAAKPGAPVHITVGTGGIAVDLSIWNGSWAVSHVDPAYGYGIVRAENRTALRWQFINVTEDGEDQVLDEVWISQIT